MGKFSVNQQSGLWILQDLLRQSTRWKIVGPLSHQMVTEKSNLCYTALIRDPWHYRLVDAFKLWVYKSPGIPQSKFLKVRKSYTQFPKIFGYFGRAKSPILRIRTSAVPPANTRKTTCHMEGRFGWKPRLLYQCFKTMVERIGKNFQRGLILLYRLCRVRISLNTSNPTKTTTSIVAIANQLNLPSPRRAPNVRSQPSNKIDHALFFIYFLFYQLKPRSHGIVK